VLLPPQMSPFDPSKGCSQKRCTTEQLDVKGREWRDVLRGPVRCLKKLQELIPRGSVAPSTSEVIAFSFEVNGPWHQIPKNCLQV
jgi:hypothetical protein